MLLALTLSNSNSGGRGGGTLYVHGVFQRKDVEDPQQKKIGIADLLI